MAEQTSDQTEQATPHRLREARKQGNVARSQDVLAMLGIASLTLAVHGLGQQALYRLARLQIGVLDRIGWRVWSTDAVAHWLVQLLLAVAALIAPLLLMLLGAAVIGNLAQTGPVFSLHPLQPDFQRLNPVSGFQRVYSLRTLFEAGKSLLKLLALATVLYLVLRGLLPGLINLSAAEPKGYLFRALDLVGALLARLLGVLFVLAMLDWMFVRWDYARRMRMSKRDIKDEVKNREGDPRIRSRLRELRQELAKRSAALAKVAQADVLITNPTHLAIALSYDHGVSGAPQVLAKGAGGMAQRMRELAQRHGIPVVQNRALARTLFREVDFDAYVPEKLYPQIAKIMVWVYALRRARTASKVN